MLKNEITIKLTESHQEFTNFITSLDEKQFTASYNQKWTAGQQLEHIYKSIKPLAEGMILPKFMVKLIFGTSNRPSKSYNSLVAKYHSKLAIGGIAPSRFAPKSMLNNQKNSLIETVSKTVNQLTSRLQKFSEKELDVFIIPHPLLGKVTLREMMYFTIYHVEHHDKISRKNLNKG